MRLTILILSLLLLSPLAALGQEEGVTSITAEDPQAVPPPPPPASGYQPPTKDEWNAAGLDPAEYALAVSYQASLEQWKEMDTSRTARRTAGWACLALGLLTVPIEATIIYGADIAYKEDPQAWGFLMATIAGGAALITGIVLLATLPGPEDLRNNNLSDNTAGLRLVPTGNGLALHWRF
ncbi:MAG: hypothetical protein GYA21_13945 [Myxococcales bacterium]|nr:hypothetical protein [Myxococcales bacterium]